MSHAFEPMNPAQQEQFRVAYLAHLHARDGAPDLNAKRFDIREKFFAQVDAAPIAWAGPPPVDQAVFDRNHARRSPERGLDEVTLWALATAKANRGERYGVEYAADHGGLEGDAASDPMAFIGIEEFYHTRILRDVLGLIGLRVEVGLPSLAARVLVRLMVRLPKDVGHVFSLCGEIVGVALFSLLLEKARGLFAAQPQVVARMETLFAQIMVDEVGHVHFARSTLSARQLAWAKRLLPLVARGVFDDNPELVELFGREELMRRVLEADVDSAAASYADRFRLPS
jgi:hypothetical protein